MLIDNKHKFKKISTLGLMGLMASTQLFTVPYFYIDAYANMKSNFELKKSYKCYRNYELKSGYE